MLRCFVWNLFPMFCLLSELEAFVEFLLFLFCFRSAEQISGYKGFEWQGLIARLTA